MQSLKKLNLEVDYNKSQLRTDVRIPIEFYLYRSQLEGLCPLFILSTLLL
jgi:hypothetical protein